MKLIISSIKESVFLKLYLIIFSLINFTYVFFEVLKSIYIQKNSLGSTIEEYHFKYISRISNIVNFLELLIIFIFLVFMILTRIKKDKMSIKRFILINSGLFISMFFINYIISFIFSVPSGNVTQQLIIPFSLTALATVYFAITTLYKKAMKI